MENFNLHNHALSLFDLFNKREDVSQRAKEYIHLTIENY